MVCRWLGEAHLTADTQAPLYFYQINPNGTFLTLSSRRKPDLLWAQEQIIRFYQSVHYTTMFQNGVSMYSMTCVRLYRETTVEAHDA